MKIVDAIIILFLLLGAVIGFKKGFIRTLVSLIGVFAVILLTMYLKKPVVTFMYTYLPFFNFGGYTIFNVFLYESIAFLLIYVLLSSVLGIIINITGIVEKILNATILLGAISKILGAIAGVLEMLLFIFIGLFVCSRIKPINPYILESRTSRIILARTPLISNAAAPTTASLNEIYKLEKENLENEDQEKFNLDSLMILVRYNVVSKEQAVKFIKDGKIKISNPEGFVLVWLYD